MRTREEILKDADGLADRDRLKIEIMLDMRYLLEKIKDSFGPNDLNSAKKN